MNKRNCHGFDAIASDSQFLHEGSGNRPISRGAYELRCWFRVSDEKIATWTFGSEGGKDTQQHPVHRGIEFLDVDA
jgi:hypothetical protein